MADTVMLTISNQYDDANLSLIVSQEGWNCCDSPSRNQKIGDIKKGGTTTMSVAKTSGHGCDGRQGQFTLNVYANSIFVGSQALDFDSNGAIEISGPPTGITTSLSGGFGSQTLIIMK